MGFFLGNIIYRFLNFVEARVFIFVVKNCQNIQTFEKCRQMQWDFDLYQNKSQRLVLELYAPVNHGFLVVHAPTLGC